MTRPGRYRLRTRLRRHLPRFLLDRGVAAKGREDCGAHRWYNHDGAVARCYHCAPAERPWPAPPGAP
ncbi:hypothetical protein [Kitasatospora sp. NPDC004272]